MGNQFVNLPAPAGNGVGAAVDVTTFGVQKTFVVSGSARANVVIEMNNDPLQAGSWAPLVSFQNTGRATVKVAARFLRVRLSNYNSYVGGVVNVNVGGTDNGTQFAALVAPAGSGVGAAVDVSALGAYKTLTAGNAFGGALILEMSEDGVADWAPMLSFQGPGQQSALAAAEFVRIKRVGVPAVAPGLPICNLGACDDSDSTGGGDRQGFLYIATGAEGDDFFVNLPAARASSNYGVTPSCQGVTRIVGIDCPEGVGDRTAAHFRVVLTQALLAGDVIYFTIEDLT